MKYLFVLLAVAASAVQTTGAVADAVTEEIVQVGRYSALAPVPTSEQTSPLNVIVSLKLPQQIDNVGMAIQFLLQRSGYRLEKDVNKEAHALLFDLPIPAVHRELGPITLDYALHTLTGPEWDMRVNHLTRKIAFFARDYRFRPEPFPVPLEDVPANDGGPVSAIDSQTQVHLSHHN